MPREKRFILAIAAIEEREILERARLEKISKPLCDLVIEERFIVKNVKSQSYKTFVAPLSEEEIGRKSIEYPTGYTVQTLLEVEPERHEIPVRRLMFAGNTPVRTGEDIIAIMPCYEERRPSWLDESNDPYYVLRPLQELEHAIEIRILSREEPVRTDRSALHSLFAKMNYPPLTSFAPQQAAGYL